MIQEKSYVYASIILIAALFGWGLTGSHEDGPAMAQVIQIEKIQAPIVQRVAQQSRRMPTNVAKRVSSPRLTRVLPPKKTSAKSIQPTRRFASLARELPPKKKN